MLSSALGTGWSASRAGALGDIVCERLTGVPADSFITEAVRRGTALEPQALAAYAFGRNIDVELVGLVRHPRISGTHASPDGLVADCGLVEIKCPATKAHLATLLTGTMPERYVTQCLWQLACTGRTLRHGFSRPTPCLTKSLINLGSHVWRTGGRKFKSPRSDQ